MSRGMPERGDPLQLAELGRAYEGELKPAGLGRLRELLANDTGLVRYRLRFDLDGRGRPFIEGRVETSLPLECQRCLQPYELALERDWHVMLLAEAAEEGTLDEGEDGRLVDDEYMLLAELVEDELILALPLVPKHPAGATCEMPPGAVEEFDGPVPAEPESEEENPFAKLSRLKRGR